MREQRRLPLLQHKAARPLCIGSHDHRLSCSCAQLARNSPSVPVPVCSRRIGLRNDILPSENPRPGSGAWYSDRASHVPSAFSSPHAAHKRAESKNSKRTRRKLIAKPYPAPTWRLPVLVLAEEREERKVK